MNCSHCYLFCPSAFFRIILHIYLLKNVIIIIYIYWQLNEEVWFCAIYVRYFYTIFTQDINKSVKINELLSLCVLFSRFKKTKKKKLG